MLPVRLWRFSPSDAPLTMGVLRGLALVLNPVSVVGEPGAEFDFEASDLSTGCGLATLLAPSEGDDGDFDERRLLLSMSSSTMPVRRSAGSSMLALFSVRVRNCSDRRSQPKNDRKSMSMISRALRFLKQWRGTAVSKGNSSYPRIKRARRSGASRRHGILVKAE
jgi:hypothetical protein